MSAGGWWDSTEDMTLEPDGETFFDAVGLDVYERCNSTPIRSFPTESQARLYAALRDAGKTDPEAQVELDKKAAERRCQGCLTWFSDMAGKGICDRCVQYLRDRGLWCETCQVPTYRGVHCRGCS